MTIDSHTPYNNKLMAVIGLSLLLHALVFALGSALLKSSGQSRPKQYTVQLVDSPAISQQVAKVTGAMPDTPTALTVADPSVTGTSEPVTTTATTKEAVSATQADKGDTRPLDPDALYDEQVIASTAQQAARQQAGAQDGVTFDTTDIMRRGYMDMLKQKVESIWHYPIEAARRGIYGDLVISFVIRKDGTLGEVKVLKTSGHRLLDDAAVKALRDGVPYWALPEGFNQEALTIRGRFIYVKGNLYLR